MKNLKHTAIILLAMTLNCNVTSAHAQSILTLEKTDEPREYLYSLLNNISDNGTAPLQEFLNRLGLNPAQTQALVAVTEVGLQTNEPHTIEIIEEVDIAGVLRQVYGYSHFGHNTWMFWRLDFVRTGKNWTVSGFQFDSEYSAVLAPRFATAKVID